LSDALIIDFNTQILQFLTRVFDNFAALCGGDVGWSMFLLSGSGGLARPDTGKNPGGPDHRG